MPDVIVFSDLLPAGATGKASRALVSTLTLVEAGTSPVGGRRSHAGS